ncbi:hypothetical protein [Bacillus sp. FSL K6-1284]|uniref:hypothetical protein n=1 Tax=Bacillus sp. FSL K6-1284 TaxID=2921468 RepID=UPI0030F6D8C5
MREREIEFYNRLCERIRETERKIAETDKADPCTPYHHGALRAFKWSAELYILMFLDGKRRRLTKKASAFHVPGHGPNFENMTDGQIEQHINKIEETLKLAFYEKENRK